MSESEHLVPLRPQLPELRLLNTNDRHKLTRKNYMSDSYNKPILSQLRNKVLVFDTETTGLFSIPRIIQIAYCKYYKSGINFSQHSHYIRQLDDNQLRELIRKEKPDVEPTVELKKIRWGEKGAQAVHQIPWEIIHDKNLPTLRSALEQFNDALNDVELIVGHNVDFDMRIVYNEARRVGFRELIQKIMSIPYVDTMKIAKKLVDARNKIGRAKMPNLGHTYKTLFPDQPDVLGFHNAIIDVDVTARCFFKLMDKTAFPDIRINPGLFSILPKSVKPAKKMGTMAVAAEAATMGVEEAATMEVEEAAAGAGGPVAKARPAASAKSAAKTRTAVKKLPAEATGAATAAKPRTAAKTRTAAKPQPAQSAGPAELGVYMP